LASIRGGERRPRGILVNGAILVWGKCEVTKGKRRLSNRREKKERKK